MNCVSFLGFFQPTVHKPSPSLSRSMEERRGPETLHCLDRLAGWQEGVPLGPLGSPSWRNLIESPSDNPGRTNWFPVWLYGGQTAWARSIRMTHGSFVRVPRASNVAIGHQPLWLDRRQATHLSGVPAVLVIGDKGRHKSWNRSPEERGTDLLSDPGRCRRSDLLHMPIETGL